MHLLINKSNVANCFGQDSVSKERQIYIYKMKENKSAKSCTIAKKETSRIFGPKRSLEGKSDGKEETENSMWPDTQQKSSF